jgi:hypothetical protein
MQLALKFDSQELIRDKEACRNFQTLAQPPHFDWVKYEMDYDVYMHSKAIVNQENEWLNNLFWMEGDYAI